MERDQASKFVNDLLRLMVSRNGSDLFLTADFPPAIKVDGKVTKVSPQPLTGQHTLALTRSIMNDKQAAEFERTKECNFAVAPQGIGRFRVNAFVQQGHVGLVMRTIPQTLPTIDSMNLPHILKDVAVAKRGLVIFVGATGSGKSTSLAAMVDHRNENTYGHIITIEDPVEFVHPHKNCIVTQREVGIDTDGWGIALKNTLRQAPDVILMGEIRDRETMEHAVAFAETGHLCLATLHANSANQALDRIINFFPEERRAQLLMDLSLNLRALVSQRLLPRQEGKGRVAAVEIMLNTPLISDLIFKGEVAEIKEIMKRSRELGMQTFDQSLFDLYESQTVTFEDALRNADSVNDLRLQIKLHSQRSRSSDLNAGTEHMAIVERAASLGYKRPLRGRCPFAMTAAHLRIRSRARRRLPRPGRDGLSDGRPPRRRRPSRHGLQPDHGQGRRVGRAATAARARRRRPRPPEDADFVFACVGNDDDLRSVTLGDERRLRWHARRRDLRRPHDRLGGGRARARRRGGGEVAALHRRAGLGRQARRASTAR